MTEDANNPEVTRVYRDLAAETTPAALDDKVLQLAAREARSRYGIARAWVRPVAWAATIGLSLAIVLEVTQIIPPAADQMPTGAPAAPAAEPASAAKSEMLLEREVIDEAAGRLQQDTAKRKDTVDAPAVGAARPANVSTSLGGGAAEEMPLLRAEERRLQASPPDAPEAKERLEVELDDADAFVATDMQILEEAETQARQRAGEPEVAAFAVLATEAAEARCDETARSADDSWYECIEELREAGETDIADRELEALRLAYPEFEVPDQSR